MKTPYDDEIAQYQKTFGDRPEGSVQRQIYYENMAYFKGCQSGYRRALDDAKEAANDLILAFSKEKS